MRWRDGAVLATAWILVTGCQSAHPVPSQEAALDLFAHGEPAAAAAALEATAGAGRDEASSLFHLALLGLLSEDAPGRDRGVELLERLARLPSGGRYSRAAALILGLERSGAEASAGTEACAGSQTVSALRRHVLCLECALDEAQVGTLRAEMERDEAASASQAAALALASLQARARVLERRNTALERELKALKRIDLLPPRTPPPGTARP